MCLWGEIASSHRLVTAVCAVSKPKNSLGFSLLAQRKCCSSMCLPNREEHLDSKQGRKQGWREGNAEGDRIFFYFVLST